MTGTTRSYTMTRWLGSLALVVGLGAALAGCAQKKEHSGFLKDYSGLASVPDMDEALFYQNPKRHLKEFTAFILDPVVIHFAPNASGTGIDPAELKELADFWHEEAVKALSKRYKVVTEPGQGVLRVRAAITGIQKTVPVANIHPAMKMSGVGLGGAAMEAEAVDSRTGERVLAVIDSRTGSRLGITAGFQTYGHAKEVMQFWVERFVKRLDEARGITG
jgi:hypothetical protein